MTKSLTSGLFSLTSGHAFDLPRILAVISCSAGNSREWHTPYSSRGWPRAAPGPVGEAGIWAHVSRGCWPRVWSAVGTRDRSVFQGGEPQSQPCTLCLSFPALVLVKSSLMAVCCVVVVPFSSINALVMISFCFWLGASLELIPILLRMSVTETMSSKRSVRVGTGQGQYWIFSRGSSPWLCLQP